MSKLFTYVPIIFFILIILFIDNSFIKWLFIPLILILIIFNKYNRSKIEKEEIEYDDRVNANISKWSLRSMFVLNTVLTLILFLVKQNIIKIDLDIELILLYLLMTLFIPFYIVPAIIKQF